MLNIYRRDAAAQRLLLRPSTILNVAAMTYLGRRIKARATLLLPRATSDCGREIFQTVSCRRDLRFGTANEAVHAGDTCARYRSPKRPVIRAGIRGWTRTTLCTSRARHEEIGVTGGWSANIQVAASEFNVAGMICKKEMIH